MNSLPVWLNHLQREKSSRLKVILSIFSPNCDCVLFSLLESSNVYFFALRADFIFSISNSFAFLFLSVLGGSNAAILLSISLLIYYVQLETKNKARFNNGRHVFFGYCMQTLRGETAKKIKQYSWLFSPKEIGILRDTR